MSRVLTPLIDCGVFKYKWPAALEYDLFTVLYEDEQKEIRGKMNAKKFVKENEGAEIVDEVHVREDESVLYHNLEKAFDEIFKVCGGVSTPRLFLGSSGNFRNDLYPDYKKSREGKPRPYYQEHAIEWLKKNYEVEHVFGYEEDDAVAMAQTKDTCIVGEDKDLLQVRGFHYNPVKKETYTISKKDGDFNLYTQIIAGDSGDDIPGVKGIGVKTASKLLSRARNPSNLFTIALEAYGGDYERMILMARLVYLLRSEDDDYIKRKEVVNECQEEEKVKTVSG